MPRWTVYTRDGIEDVGADVLDVVGGALVFRDELGVSVAYSPSTWTTVTRDEDD
jgi:hypothetical protein